MEVEENMFSPQVKHRIATEVQRILQETGDWELPDGEISFILHVDGEDDMSWANIRNTSEKDSGVPTVLLQNLTAR